MYEIMFYETDAGRVPVQEYLSELQKKNKIRDAQRIFDSFNKLKRYGMQVNQYHPETIRKLQDDIWELRPDGHRIAFFYFDGNKFVMLHAFKKQHHKAPQKEIERAISEMKNYVRRSCNGK